MRAILFGLAVGAAIQGWRNYPPDGPVNRTSAHLLILAALAAAYLAGKRGRGNVAVAAASAEATAEAVSTSSSTVQIAFVTPGMGAAAHQERGAVMVPDFNAVEWSDGHGRALPTVDDLDGMELSDLDHDHDRETERA